MRTAIAAALTAALVTTLTTPATPAAAAETAPTNVRIAWKDSTYQRVVVSWDETEPVANLVTLRTRGDRNYFSVTTTADQPNAIEVEAARIRDYSWYSPGKPLEFVVAGGPSSAVSPGFDAFAPNQAHLIAATRSAAGATTVRWQPPTGTDLTPNDPLDRNLPLTYQVSYIPASTGRQVPIGGRTTATQVTYTLRSEYKLQVVAHNEWGGQFPTTMVTANATRITAHVPSWAVYDSDSVVTGTYTPADQQRQVVLQARNSSTSPWYTVRSITARGGRFEFPLGTGGSRQYRVTAPTSQYYNGALVYNAASTAPAASTTQLRVLGAFWYTQILAGWTNEARLYVAPKVNTTATLQRWNGKTWTTVGPVKVKNGYGVGYIRTTAKGRTAYRYYVPATTYAGVYFAAAYTQNFVNVVV
ncbi:hypothetical protein FB561_0907 [Kribbella amoyensis]|uniref:Fibronectin type-III domain-containing protein n=1 Tax=Kribbella amoyensis TaxID=996641 RepID=A0A561BLT2_9ACTN|nr:hypothetical protein FB561_0907 [Kribbella amoyensis]